MVTPGFYPVKGGTETVVRNLTLRLNKRGIHTDVMTFNMERKWDAKWHGKTERVDGFTVYRIPALNWMPVAHSNKVTLGINLIPANFRHIMRSYDIIHFHEFELSFPLFSLTVKKPKIIHSHGVNLEFLRRYHLSRFLLKHIADYYISITKKMRKGMIRIGFPANRVIYLPNGVDTNLFKPEGKKEENLLLFVGRITANKGLHVLLKALDYLKTSVRLAIIGPADWDNDYYQAILKSIERENQKSTHEIEYLGALDQSEVIKWYQKASVFILPSFIEGFPVTVLEALSCETPVIATSVGGIPEIIQNYETGILVSPNDHKGLADAIQYLLENKDVRLKVGRKGRKRVIEEYSLDNACKKLCVIYKQINSNYSKRLKQ